MSPALACAENCRRLERHYRKLAEKETARADRMAALAAEYEARAAEDAA